MTWSSGSGARHTVVNRRRPTDPRDAAGPARRRNGATSRRDHLHLFADRAASSTHATDRVISQSVQCVMIAPAGPYSLFHSRLASPQLLFKCTCSSTRATQLVGMKWCWPSGLSFLVSLIVVALNVIDAAELVSARAVDVHVLANVRDRSRACCHLRRTFP